MDERDSVKREAETARKRMSDITGELSQRTQVGRRVKAAAKQKTTEAKSFLASHPVAVGVTGGLIGLALGALIPMGKRERGLVERLEAKIDALTAMDGDEDEELEKADDSELSPEPGAAASDDLDDDDDDLAAAAEEDAEESDEADEDGGTDDGSSRMPS